MQCQSLTAPTNGALSTTATSYQTVVNFTSRQCETLAVPANGALRTTATSYQTVVNFTSIQCDTLTVPANGALSTTATSYQIVVNFTSMQCQSPTAPTNGALSTTATSYQTVVNFTCNTGYVLNGTTNTTCQANGTWSNPVPTCTPIQCHTLMVPTNGVLSTTATSYQTVVNFTCNPGYVLNGTTNTTCQANGTWSNPAPTCTPMQCNTLTVPTNGALSTTATSYQIVVNFTYIQCISLPTPKNGGLSPAGSYRYQDVVNFTCDTGYELNGTANTMCQANRTWSNPVPTCTRIQCVSLLTPTNGVLSPAGPYSYQDVVNFTCDTGYELNGTADTMCQANRTWSNPVPTCTRVQCISLPTLTNGEVSPAGPYSYQDVVNFTCDTGYELNGTADTMCQANRTWSNPVPTCTRIQCISLPTPTNGVLSPAGPYRYQDVVNFTCDTGYELNGTADTMCQANRTWSNPVPTCTRVQCISLTTLTNGEVSPAGPYSYQDVVNFTCDTGYELNGTADTMCQANRTWSNPVPTCTRVQCISLPILTNGELSPAGPYSYQDVVNFTCDTGYELNGTADTMCQANRTWSNPVPTCTRVQCISLSTLTNGEVSPAGPNSFQDVVNFTCDTGYELNGTADTMCQANRTWSNPVPTCTRVQCISLPTLTNGEVSPAGPYSYQDVVNFTCDTGYELNGTADTMCQANRTWSNPVPTCTRVQCISLPTLTNGEVSPAGPYSYQDVVNFTCDTGYELNGTADTMCQANRTWSNPVPTCTRVQCISLPAPTNGELSPVGPYRYQDVVTFTCDTGYELNGTSDTMCQADETWSNPVPTCTSKIIWTLMCCLNRLSYFNNDM
ncbi:PREDICTED: CUB and sushi domain-containing protein 3-like [Branchiostoma belcheri]|uniref:CUB and sushi domain-containing protein 3-like n=1 Tax=Branchiostoma belcheri TaxID=7741 RepID=A0A6P4Z9T9_BRABE|nr:PREDICTED: CUB and sushi domain-containing protein 3-like [Branchiostoma belcheri]